MDPITLSALIGAGVQVVGGIIGELMASGRRGEAEALRKAAIQRYGDVPELGASAMESVHADPKLAQSQMRALDRLGEVDKAGGLTLSDQAALNKVTNQVNGNATSQRLALMENMAARGQAGSGAEVAIAMKAQQDAANRLSQQGMDVEGMAQQRAFDAIMARGKMAGSMRDQDFGEQSSRAKAKDLRAIYNGDLRKWKTSGQVQGELANAAAIEGDGARTSQMIGELGNVAGQGIQYAGSKGAFGRSSDQSAMPLTGMSQYDMLNPYGDDEDSYWTNPYGPRRGST